MKLRFREKHPRRRSPVERHVFRTVIERRLLDISILIDGNMHRHTAALLEAADRNRDVRSVRIEVDMRTTVVIEHGSARIPFRNHVFRHHPPSTLRNAGVSYCPV